MSNRRSHADKRNTLGSSLAQRHKVLNKHRHQTQLAPETQCTASKEHFSRFDFQQRSQVSGTSHTVQREGSYRHRHQYRKCVQHKLVSSILVTFLSLGHKTQHSRCQRREVYLGSHSVEVSAHSWLASKQGSMVERPGGRQLLKVRWTGSRAGSREEEGDELFQATSPVTTSSQASPHIPFSYNLISGLIC